MAKVCQVTGKRPLSGNNVSHANNKTRRRFYPNLHTHRFWVESENRFVKLKLSAKGLRVIDKKGIEEFLKNTNYVDTYCMFAGEQSVYEILKFLLNQPKNQKTSKVLRSHIINGCYSINNNKLIIILVLILFIKFYSIRPKL